MTHLPGYYTASELAAYLRMSRQNLYQSGLMDALKSYKVGAVRLYKKADVEKISHWLYVRQGLVALGRLEEKSPLADKGMMARANEENEFSYECPICGGFAVSNPDETPVRYWCEKDGVIGAPLSV